LEVHEKKRGELSSGRSIGNTEENIPQVLNRSVATTTIWCGIRRFSASARAMMCSTEEELKAKWAEKKKGPTAPPPVLFLFLTPLLVCFLTPWMQRVACVHRQKG
jgi:hypothetical protein